MRGLARILCILTVLTTGAVSAQDRAQTLADIRQELVVLYAEIQRLNTELSTSGGPQVNTGGGSLLDRLNTLESELTRLTAKTEELEFRVNRVVSDGTLRISDLEFRLCELEEGCDLGQLSDARLGGGAETKPVAAPAPVQPSGTQLAENEQSDFERASEALASGDFRSAADQFATFNQTYPSGPLEVAADLRLGEALEGLGDTRAAAKAYLEAFQLEQDGPLASEALYLLGRALGRLGQTEAACTTLSEIAARFPGAEAEARASQEMLGIGCG